ncbi:MAG: hypothetical protein QXO15_01150, partial [Nitrososphaerota archaeon]
VDGGRIEIIGNLIDLASFKNVPQLEVEVYGETLKLTRKWIVRGVVRSCTIEVRRYVDAEKFALMLGLYRADGLKKYERVRFTNKDPLLHRWFIEPLKEMGVRKFLAYCYYCYCEKCGQEKLKNAIRRFEEITGVKVIRRYQRKLAHNPLFITDINSKPLAIFIKHAERTLRKEIVRGNAPRSIARKYIRGVLEGDGSIAISIEEEKVDGMHFEIFESDEEAIKDLKIIIKKVLGIDLKIYPGDKQESSINLYELLDLLLSDVVPARFIDRVKQRLLISFRKKGVPWVLVMLAKSFERRWFTSTEASHILHKARHHTLELLKKLEEMEYLMSRKTKIKSRPGAVGTPVRRIFKISEKGRKMIKLFSSLLHPLFPYLQLPFKLIK